MSITISKSDTNIITMVLTGNVNLDERIAAVDEVVELVKFDDTLNLLVDIRDMTMHMSLEDQEYYGNYIASKDKIMKADVRFALVHGPEGNPSMMISAFTYAKGLHLNQFTEMDEAICWLTGIV